MFFSIRGWRCSNRAKYIGKGKVEGSIHESTNFIVFQNLARKLRVGGLMWHLALAIPTSSALKPYYRLIDKSKSGHVRDWKYPLTMDNRLAKADQNIGIKEWDSYNLNLSPEMMGVFSVLKQSDFFKVVPIHHSTVLNFGMLHRIAVVAIAPLDNIDDHYCRIQSSGTQIGVTKW